MKDDSEDQGEPQEDHEGPRDERPGHVTEAQLRERGREVADAARSENDQGEASEERQRAEGYDEGRQSAPGHEQAVEQPAEGAEEQHDRDGDAQRHAGRPQESEEGAGETGHRFDGEVDLAGDDDQGHRQGHDRDLHQGRDQVCEVARREEEGR